MQNAKNLAAVNKRLSDATSNHETVNPSKFYSQAWHLNDHTPASIHKALDESHVLISESLVDNMYESFHGAVTYLANAQEAGTIDQKTIADDIFSLFFKPFTIYYNLQMFAEKK